MARETINGISVPIPGTGEPPDFVGDLRRIASDLATSFAGTWDPTKVVAIGDSWTEGNQDGTGTTYPALVGTALSTWATVTNLGKSGWTSTEIAIRMGAPVTIDAVTLPASTATAAVTILAPTTKYRSSSATAFSWTGDIRDKTTGAVLASGVTLKHDASGAELAGWTVERPGGGSSVSIPSGSVFVCTEYETSKNGTYIIAVGRNNYTDPTVVVRDVNSILAARRSPGAPFLVLAVPTVASETSGTVPYARIRRTNAALKAAFPNEFTDTRRYLIDRGAVVTGTSLTAGGSSLDHIIGDTIPQALLYASAYDHPNATGYKAIAACVLDGLAKVGALRGPSSGVTGVTTTAIGPAIWSAQDLPDALGSPVNQQLDRTGYLIMQSASTSAAPLLSYDAATGRRYYKFDGTDDNMLILTGGNVAQPFTIIAKAKFRDLTTEAQGVFWTYDTPGATFSVSTSGRVVLNAATAVQTATGAVAQGSVVTIASVANGASSAAGIVGTAFTTGDAGTRQIVTQGRVGYYFDTAARYADMDLYELRFYPWALSEAQITTIATQIG